MGLDLKSLVDENLPKGSIRVLVIVVLFAVVYLTGQNVYLNKGNDTFTKGLLEKCQNELYDCNMMRIKESQEHSYKLEQVNKVIDEVRTEIKVQTKSIDKKLK